MPIVSVRRDGHTFHIGQEVTYDGKFCIITSFPDIGMVSVRNSKLRSGDWSTAKISVSDLIPHQPQTNKSPKNCICASTIIFNRGCQCGGN